MSRSISESKGLHQPNASNVYAKQHIPSSYSFPVKMVEKRKQQAPIAQSEPSDTDVESAVTSPSAIGTGSTQMGSGGTKTPMRRESTEATVFPQQQQQQERKSFINNLLRSKRSVNSVEASTTATNTLRGIHYFDYRI